MEISVSKQLAVRLINDAIGRLSNQAIHPAEICNATSFSAIAAIEELEKELDKAHSGMQWSDVLDLAQDAAAQLLDEHYANA